MQRNTLHSAETLGSQARFAQTLTEALSLRVDRKLTLAFTHLSHHSTMFSRLVGQTQTASQEQVSDKAAAGVSALAKLVHAISEEGDQVLLTCISSVSCMP